MSGDAAPSALDALSQMLNEQRLPQALLVPACRGRRSRGALVAELADHGALIPLTVPEVRRLVYLLVVRILAPPEAVLHWSRWRRRHLARAIRAHY